jgi:hypothetical protein
MIRAYVAVTWCRARSTAGMVKTADSRASASAMMTALTTLPASNPKVKRRFDLWGRAAIGATATQGDWALFYQELLAALGGMVRGRRPAMKGILGQIALAAGSAPGPFGAFCKVVGVFC